MKGMMRNMILNRKRRPLFAITRWFAAFPFTKHHADHFWHCCFSPGHWQSLHAVHWPRFPDQALESQVDSNATLGSRNFIKLTLTLKWQFLSIIDPHLCKRKVASVYFVIKLCAIKQSLALRCKCTSIPVWHVPNLVYCQAKLLDIGWRLSELILFRVNLQLAESFFYHIRNRQPWRHPPM